MEMNLETRVNQMAESLREQGLRLTPQRLAILGVLLSNRAHPTAEQIYEQVHKDFPTTSLATVYKTMLVLKETGHVVELGFNDGSNRYDVVTEPHAHLICVNCKSILDPEVEGVGQFTQKIIEMHGYKLVNQRLDIFGICPECQALLSK
ncbi:MAG: transcriptional repressor [Anaerolineae bacterium]|nr:transcriptional repressor [Anaerolineae bacterium]